MSLLRALRAYVGLGPDEEFESDYLADLDGRSSVNARSTSDDGGGRNVRRARPDHGGEAVAARSAESRSPLNGAQPARTGRPGSATGVSRRQSRPTGPDSDTDSYTDSYTASPANDIEADGPRPDQVPADGDPSLDDQPHARRSDVGDSGAAGDDTAADGSAVVHSLASMRAKPKTVVPDSFVDAKAIADDFKTDVPIVLNLQGVERELGRRLIDFTSGLCYGLDGTMEKIAPQVFLIVPEGIEVNDEDRQKIHQRGYAR